MERQRQEREKMGGVERRETWEREERERARKNKSTTKTARLKPSSALWAQGRWRVEGRRSGRSAWLAAAVETLRKIAARKMATR